MRSRQLAGAVVVVIHVLCAGLLIGAMAQRPGGGEGSRALECVGLSLFGTTLGIGLSAVRAVARHRDQSGRPGPWLWSPLAWLIASVLATIINPPRDVYLDTETWAGLTLLPSPLSRPLSFVVLLGSALATVFALRVFSSRSSTSPASTLSS